MRFSFRCYSTSELHFVHCYLLFLFSFLPIFSSFSLLFFCIASYLWPIGAQRHFSGQKKKSSKSPIFTGLVPLCGRAFRFVRQVCVAGVPPRTRVLFSTTVTVTAARSSFASSPGTLTAGQFASPLPSHSSLDVPSAAWFLRSFTRAVPVRTPSARPAATNRFQRVPSTVSRCRQRQLPTQRRWRCYRDRSCTAGTLGAGANTWEPAWTCPRTIGRAPTTWSTARNARRRSRSRTWVAT